MRKFVDTIILIVLLLGPAALLMSLGQGEELVAETTSEVSHEKSVDEKAFTLTEADIASIDYPRP